MNNPIDEQSPAVRDYLRKKCGKWTFTKTASGWGATCFGKVDWADCRELAGKKIAIHRRNGTHTHSEVKEARVVKEYRSGNKIEADLV